MAEDRDAKIARLTTAFVNAYRLVTHKRLGEQNEKNISEQIIGVGNGRNLDVAERDVDLLRSVIPNIDSVDANVYSLTFNPDQASVLREKIMRTAVYKMIADYNKHCKDDPANPKPKIGYDVDTTSALQIVRSVFQWHEAVGQGDNSYLKIPSPALELSACYGTVPMTHGYYNEITQTLKKGHAVKDLGFNFRPWSPIFIFAGGSISDYRYENLTDPYHPESTPVGNDRRQSGVIDVVTPDWINILQRALYGAAGLVSNGHLGLSDPSDPNCSDAGVTDVRYEDYHIHNTRAISTPFDPRRESTGWDLSLMQTYSQYAAVGVITGHEWGHIDGLKFDRKYIGWQGMRTDELTGDWRYWLDGKATDGWFVENTYQGMVEQSTRDLKAPWIPPAITNRHEVTDEDTNNNLKLKNWALHAMFKVENSKLQVAGMDLPTVYVAVTGDRTKDQRLQPRSEYKAEVGIGWVSVMYGEVLNYAPKVWDPQPDPIADRFKAGYNKEPHMHDHRSYETGVGVHIPVGSSVKLNVDYTHVHNPNYDSHYFIDGRRSRGVVDSLMATLTISFGGSSQEKPPIEYLIAESQCYMAGQISPENRGIIYDYWKKMYRGSQAFGGTEPLLNDASLTRRPIPEECCKDTPVAAPVVMAPPPPPAVPAAAPTASVASNPIQIGMRDKDHVTVQAFFLSGGSGSSGLTAAGRALAAKGKDLVKFLFSNHICSLEVTIEGSASAGGAAARNLTLSNNRANDGKTYLRDTLRGISGVGTPVPTVDAFGDTRSIVEENAWKAGLATAPTSAELSAFRARKRYYTLVIKLDPAGWPAVKSDPAKVAELERLYPGLPAQYDALAAEAGII